MNNHWFNRSWRDFSALNIWLVCAVVYLGLQVGHLRQKVPSLVDFYLTDVLCLPLVLGLVLGAQRLWSADREGKLPLWHGVSAVIIYSVYFEVLLPRWNEQAIGDPLDGLSYLLGWLIFEIFINRRRNLS